MQVNDEKQRKFIGENSGAPMQKAPDLFSGAF